MSAAPDPSPAVGRWARLSGSLRFRASVGAVLIVSAAFALGGASVVWALRSSLESSTANTASAEALDIASFITTRGRVPVRLPVSIEDTAAQVVSESGTVLSASQNLAGQPPMVDLHPAPGKLISAPSVVLHPRITQHARLHLDFDSRFAVSAVGFSGQGLSGTVLVAASLGAADRAVMSVATALVAAFALLAVLVGALVWAVTGLALRPVERIRREVAELSVSNLRRQLVEPPGDDEIRRLAQTMNTMLERLARSTERERQLVGDVSHELRNPLASLRTQLEVATINATPGSSNLLAGAIAEVERMSTLVDGLLTLERLDNGTLLRHDDDVDLDELALTEGDRLRGRRRVDVSVRGVGGARVRGDEGQLRRMVANLADNAERHARRRVAFVVRQEGNFAVIEVVDDGPGVPPEMRERVFERFVRLDTARSHRDSGAGLGLAIVRQIARAHGGAVWVEDAEPGARFVVRLPRPAPGPTPGPRPPARESRRRPSSSPLTPRVRD